MKRSIKKIIEEEFELAKNRILSRIGRMFDCDSSRSSMRLQFKDRKISPTILTGEEIKGEGNTTLQVVLVNDSTGHVVDVGPESSASIQIVLLEDGGPSADHDDCSAEEFDSSIARETEGKKPLLSGNLRIKLQGGVGVVENVKLRHHASKIRPSVFRLGARVVEASFGGVRIKEARTEAFTVRDFRNKYYKKHETPSLSDEVSRLVNIRKGGKIDKRLRDGKIFTVEDFLIRLLIDPEGLKSIAKMGPKKWEATVNNARASPADKRMYFYVNSEQKKGIVFNHFGQVLGLYSENQYDPNSVLPENQMYAQELLASAYEHWEQVVAFDDINSLQQYFAGLSTHEDPTDSSGYESTKEIQEEEPNDQIFSLETMFPGFDEYLQSCDDHQYVNWQSTNEVAGAIGTRPKGWKLLYCVSRLFSVKKRLSIDGINTHKKRKFG